MGNGLFVTKTVEIKASPERIWRVLTDPEFTRQYMFGCDVISDWTVGAPVVWRGATDGKIYVKGNVVDIELGRLLQYTVFDPNMGLEDIAENYLTVTYELAPRNGVTSLAISQGDFARVANGEKRRADTLVGWESVLQVLKALAEKAG